MVTTDLPSQAEVSWPGAVRIIRSLYPPIDLFEDIADPADWPLLIAAEQKTNPRLSVSIGNLDLVPPERRVSGPGASYLMAPFVHASTDRPTRFSDGTYGLLYAGDRFEVALMETIYHHERAMAASGEEPGWTSQFREITLKVQAAAYDLRGDDRWAACLDPDSYAASQALGRRIRAEQGEAIVYPSQRYIGGDAIALFYPDLARRPTQGRHLDYYWDGARVAYVRDVSADQVYEIA